MSTRRQAPRRRSPRLAIELHAVSVRRGRQRVLVDISLELAAGGRWALIGGNGAGKTQLLKLLAGDVWATPTSRAGLVYRLGGKRLERRAAKRYVAYLGAERQDKYARYGWNLAVRDVVATGVHGTDLLLTPITPALARRVDAMLRSCGLAALAARRFASLSYGQKRLTLLARALVSVPQWLLLDEFYNGLDERFRARIDAILERARRRGQSWIAAAHRAVDVPRGTTRIMELAGGHLGQVGPFRRADALRLARRARETQGPVLRTAPGKGRLLLGVRGVDLYVDYRCVLRQVDWQLRRGEHWAIFGANGAGKSSLLRLLYGDLSPALGGRIERPGFPRGTPIAAWKRHVGFVSPELQTDYASDVTVFDLVASGRHASIGLAAAASAADRRATLHWLEFFGLKSCTLRPARELSYGQLRRALFARALAADPFLLLLDEPLTGLDPGQRAQIKGLLQRLMARGMTVVMAVHHPEDLPRGITHGLRLQQRRAVLMDSGSAN
jgi:molybdate transport system ATP-binding protein